MTGRVFTKLFFSFVVVLFLGMAVLDFSLREVMEQVSARPGGELPDQ